MLINIFIIDGSGGGVGVECLPMVTAVPGSIPGKQQRHKFFLQSSHQFSASVSAALTLDVGLFYLSVFPMKLFK